MSYVRFGDDSDVYVYDDRSGTLCCCGCQLSYLRISYYAETAAEMADHLREHEAAGHMVPAGVIDKIASTAYKDDERARIRADRERRRMSATDVAGARMLGVLADILDTPHESPLPSLSMRALRAIDQLREWGIHPGQRDADGLPVPPPHDDDCQVCGGER